jgi:glycosyltransferase involved in cell wall biosynthesis
VTGSGLTVAYVIPSLAFGGAERQLSILVRSLPPSVRPVVVSLSSDLEPFGAVLLSRGIEVVAIKRTGHVEPRRLFEAARAIRSRGADVVHGFLDAANAYAFVSARLLRKPVVLSLRNEKLTTTGARRAALSWMLRRADEVLVNSRSGAAFLRDRIGVADERILYLANWVDPEKISGAREVPPAGASPVIGFVGRFARQKRLDLLVDAFRELVLLVPDARLVLQGGGPERETIERRVESLGLSGRVELRPMNPEVGATLGRLHAFVMTSAYEGLPNSAIEALSRGVPIVSTRVGDVSELVVEGRTGFFFEDEDPRSMARTIARAVMDRDLLGSAALLGPRIVREKFSIEGAVEKLETVYRRLARR